jgi:hypothetical protein
MDAAKLARASQPAVLGGYLKKNLLAAGRAMHGHAGHGALVRTAEHNGHQITLTTTYRVAVDGKVLKIPLMVDDSGNVHCHSLPNYQFDSAIDMIKAVIDSFPDDFPPKGVKGTRAAKRTKPSHTHRPATTGRKGRGSGRRKA